MKHHSLTLYIDRRDARAFAINAHRSSACRNIVKVKGRRSQLL